MGACAHEVTMDRAEGDPQHCSDVSFPEVFPVDEVDDGTLREAEFCHGSANVDIRFVRG
jgi:hypothetical protein